MIDNRESAARQTGARRRLALVMRRFPWSGRAVQFVYRIWQPRFSVGVIGVLLDEFAERVLLVEHIFHTFRPWGLPGGWIARGEDPARTAEREYREETGLHVRAVTPLLIQRTPELHHHMDIVFLMALDGDGQTIRLNRELLDYRWFSCDDLPPLVAIYGQAIRAALEWVARGKK